MKACNLTCAVLPPGSGVIDQTGRGQPGKSADNVLPLRVAFAVVLLESSPLYHSIVVSVGSTTNSVAIFPQGTSGMTPDHLPANFFEIRGVGDGEFA